MNSSSIVRCCIIVIPWPTPHTIQYVTQALCITLLQLALSTVWHGGWDIDPVQSMYWWCTTRCDCDRSTGCTAWFGGRPAASRLTNMQRTTTTEIWIECWSFSECNQAIRISHIILPYHSHCVKQSNSHVSEMSVSKQVDRLIRNVWQHVAYE